MKIILHRKEIISYDLVDEKLCIDDINDPAIIYINDDFNLKKELISNILKIYLYEEEYNHLKSMSYDGDIHMHFSTYNVIDDWFDIENFMKSLKRKHVLLNIINQQE